MSSLTDEIDKQKRELLAARQAKEAAEHRCITEVLSENVTYCHGFKFSLNVNFTHQDVRVRLTYSLSSGIDR